MKYRLVIDHYANTKDPWYLVQKWENDRWALVSCGYEAGMRKIYNRAISHIDESQYEVVEQDESEMKTMFKAREAKADLSV